MATLRMGFQGVHHTGTRDKCESPGKVVQPGAEAIVSHIYLVEASDDIG